MASSGETAKGIAEKRVCFGHDGAVTAVQAGHAHQRPSGDNSEAWQCYSSVSDYRANLQVASNLALETLT